MIKHTEKIQSLIESSREVIRHSLIDNGAIIRAHIEGGDIKQQAEYRTVWPREAAFTAIAAEKLGLPAAEKFFHWLHDKLEGFEHEKLIYGNYSTSGKIGSAGRSFQPDQMGTVLWAIAEFVNGDAERALPYRNLIDRLCDGLTASWNSNAFIPDSVDIWNDHLRRTSLRTETNFTYSLAACAYGLLQAHALFPTKSWKQTAQQMQKRIESSYDKHGYFLRSHGKVDDTTIDASLLGLAWPFSLWPVTDKRIKSTVETIEQTLSVDGGLRRFQFDYATANGSARDGGGLWPVLNFWMAIVQAKSDQREQAERYLHWVIDRVTKAIPEQFFTDHRRGVSPSTWSHAMFILACHQLGIPLTP